MYIKSLIAMGFRCFGNKQPTRIDFTKELTVLVGNNGSGKTAVMHALLRLFGISQEQRSIQRGDFYLAPSEASDLGADRRLSLEVILAFPELATEEKEAHDTVPEFFNQMCVVNPGEPPHCRIRLEATWSDDGTSEGGIQEQLYWLTTPEDVSFGDEENPHRIRMQPAQRGKIQVLYIPATRDGAALTRQAMGHLNTRLLKAVLWAEETKQSLQDLNAESQTLFTDEPAIGEITETLTALWGKLNASTRLETTPKLSLISREFEEVIKKITITLSPTEGGGERGLESLSDGQKSLFFLALISTVLETEKSVKQAEREGGAELFLSEKMRIPILTILAMEEPENHLAPFYLSRIVRHVRDLVKSPHSMAILSSHSPGVLGRIYPEEVRHFRLEPTTRTALIREIELPRPEDEAYTFVREAVIAYPELYFARCVILGEGDSEQIILPKLAEGLGFTLDPSFVAVVPLGGRHVNHFWRLLDQLEIPYVTLLDLDLGRYGGGWHRLAYVNEQLHAIGENEDEYEADRYELSGLVDSGWDDVQLNYFNEWLDWLEKDFAVYFSAPLDIDLLMLSSFPCAYTQLNAGERGPSAGHVQEAMQTALGENALGPVVYSGVLKPIADFFPWYRYRFMTKSKPVSHMQALGRLSKDRIKESCPSRIKSLLEKVKEIVERGP